MQHAYPVNPKANWCCSQSPSRANANVKGGPCCLFHNYDYSRRGDVFRHAQITENLNSFIAELKRLKPASSKGIYLQDIYLSTSMGPGYRIDVSQF